MSKKNNTVKIENGKVILSDEILEIIESWRTEENSEWIDKYLKIILDPSSIGSKKSRSHHIIPCFTFKDENHTNRKMTQPLSDSIKENIIELSISNHIKAHNCLRFIFPNNKDARFAVQQLCGEERYKDSLSEEEINEISKIEEECAKENQTKDELKEWYDKWYSENKTNILRKNKQRYKRNKEKYLATQKEYRKNNHEKIAKQYKKYTEENKEKISQYKKEWWEINKEKISKQKKEKYNKNKEEISRQRKENYKKNKEIILNRNKKYYENNKEQISKKNKEYSHSHKDIVSKKNKNYNHKKCIDPKKGDECTMSALIKRKYRNKELYKDINLSDCIIKKVFNLVQIAF